MSIFKCKMCGGTIEFNLGDTVGICDSCGTKQTLPRLDDDKKTNLYDRANHFRRNNEFDKAMGIYEQILNEDNTDAEAYWSLVLCRYGIEYVEDPATHKRVPTVNRAQYTSIFADEDYKSALKYADSYQRTIYEDEARAIDDIQKGILEISNKEEPFDVFICYKETDDSGRRTMDSVLANDLYHQLAQEGFKVFFSRITLENKLGTDYEPYIFAALNSAKVMVVLGTKPEYFNAVWVKNEWSRYLALVKVSKGKKMLIPAYKDMDPYDLPEEFSHLQAQDMSKLGFMQDLIRGIKKIITADAPRKSERETVIVQQGGGGTTANAQVQRGYMALEDNEWEKADGFFEEALNLDPKCAEAYIGKLLVRDKKPRFDSWITMQKKKYARASTERLEAIPEDNEHINQSVREFLVTGYLKEDSIRSQYKYDRDYDSFLSCRKIQKEEQLAELSSDRLLTRARQYAEGKIQKWIETGIAEITAALDGRIARAQEEDEQSIAGKKAAYEAYLKETDQKVHELNSDAQNRREQNYQNALAKKNIAHNITDYEAAKKALRAMNGYKDSEALAVQCDIEIDKIIKKTVKKRKMAIVITVVICVTCIVAAIAVKFIIEPNSKYNSAVSLMNMGNYEEAIAEFEALDGYRDSSDKINECQNILVDNKYDAAVELMDSGKYEEAITAFEELAGYRESADKIAACQDGIKNNKYESAVELMNNGQYEEAISMFVELTGYKDSNEKIKNYEKKMMKTVQVGDNVIFGSYEQDNDETNGTESVEWIVLDKQEDRMLIISKYALDCQPYNVELEEITWESCTLRSWLNNDFYNTAFNDEEKLEILQNNVVADKNPDYGTNPGNDTADKIFLLSITEVEKYFPDDDARMCVPTEYAISQGTWTSSDYKADGKATCWWWLRSPGDSQKYDVNVSIGGSVNYLGSLVTYDDVCVRPALWINLSKL